MTDRRVLVTGASSGIGRATAKYLLDCGYNVILTSRDEIKLKHHFGAYDETRVGVVAFDFTKLEDIRKFCLGVVEKFGCVKSLVICAGQSQLLPLELIDYKKTIALFEINTVSAFELIRGFFNKGFSKDDPSIVLISSISTKEAAPGRSVYAATKGALEGYLKTSARELLKKNIRINILLPGLIHSEMTDKYLSKLSDKELEIINNQYPLGIGKPEYLAYFIEFLISDKGKWITGQSFILDGGSSLF